MVKSALEKYYQKGWLKFGKKEISAEERLSAGYMFYRSYAQSHVLSVGVIDFERPAVGGGMRANAVEAKVEFREFFLRAYRAMPEYCRWIAQKVILENKALRAGKNDERLYKEMLCAALDGLASYYMKAGREDEKR